MAEIPAIPTNKNISMLAGVNTYVTLTPKDPDGAVIDLTGFNVATFKTIIDFNYSNPVTVTASIASAGPTGCVVLVAANNQSAIYDQVGFSRTNWYCEVGDGTDTVKAGYGALQIVPTGF